MANQREKRRRKRAATARGFYEIGVACMLAASRYWQSQPHRCGNLMTGYCRECDDDPSDWQVSP